MDDFLKESADNIFLVLYHGSNNQKVYSKFHDNQFYTTNDYIAENYAYNFGGLFYKVQVDKLNPYELKAYDKRRDTEKHDETVGLLRSLYDDHVAHNYEQRYFMPSPSSTFGEYGWKPIIDWCKTNGYDSLEFIDESYDTYVRDTTYLIFDGAKVEILGVYDFIDDEIDFTENKMNEKS